MNTTPTIRPYKPAAYNIIGGWLGMPIPTPPRPRNMTRAGYRKTGQKRQRRTRPGQLDLAA